MKFNQTERTLLKTAHDLYREHVRGGGESNLFAGVKVAPEMGAMIRANGDEATARELQAQEARHRPTIPMPVVNGLASYAGRDAAAPVALTGNKNLFAGVKVAPEMGDAIRANRAGKKEAA